jgi:hypothetical protein
MEEIKQLILALFDFAMNLEKPVDTELAGHGCTWIGPMAGGPTSGMAP